MGKKNKFENIRAKKETDSQENQKNFSEAAQSAEIEFITFANEISAYIIKKEFKLQLSSDPKFVGDITDNDNDHMPVKILASLKDAEKTILRAMHTMQDIEKNDKSIEASAILPHFFDLYTLYRGGDPSEFSHTVRNQIFKLGKKIALDKYAANNIDPIPGGKKDLLDDYEKALVTEVYYRLRAEEDGAHLKDEILSELQENNKIVGGGKVNPNDIVQQAENLYEEFKASSKN